MPEISVIIPCYNQGEYIDEAVESVLNQSYQDFEIVIINDGSTDEFTIHLLSHYEKRKTRVIHSPNRGLANARNAAIMEAEGKFILPLDADDKIGSEYLKKAFDLLSRDVNSGIVYCEAELFGDRKGSWNLPEYSLDRMLLDNLIFASALFRKQDWQKVGGYNPNMKCGWEDWDFWLSIIELGRKVYRIPEELFYYRIKNHSMHGKLSKNDYIELHTQLFNNHEKLYVDNIKLIFSELYNVKNSLSYKLGKVIKNPRRIYDKFFRI